MQFTSHDRFYYYHHLCCLLIPRRNGQLRGICFHLMTSSCQIVVTCQTSPRLTFFKGQPQRNESSADHLVMAFSWRHNFANNVQLTSELATSMAAHVLSSVTWVRHVVYWIYIQLLTLRTVAIETSWAQSHEKINQVLSKVSWQEATLYV